MARNASRPSHWRRDPASVSSQTFSGVRNHGVNGPGSRWAILKEILQPLQPQKPKWLVIGYPWLMMVMMASTPTLQNPLAHLSFQVGCTGNKNSEDKSFKLRRVLHMFQAWLENTVKKVDERSTSAKFKSKVECPAWHECLSKQIYQCTCLDSQNGSMMFHWAFINNDTSRIQRNDQVW